MDHYLIHQLTDAPVHQFHTPYQVEWWTRGRELQRIRQMLARGDNVFGAEWTACWEDLVEFEIIRVITLAEAAAEVADQL